MTILTRGKYLLRERRACQKHTIVCETVLCNLHSKQPLRVCSTWGRCKLHFTVWREIPTRDRIYKPIGKHNPNRVKSSDSR